MVTNECKQLEIHRARIAASTLPVILAYFPVKPAISPVIPASLPVIPAFSPVIPAKAGIHDSRMSTPSATTDIPDNL
jgi:hypothetical protein